MVRARRDCIQSGLCQRGSPILKNLTRFLIKNAEHTQGVQGEDWSPGWAGPTQKLTMDTSHWSNEEFAKVHNNRHDKFRMGELTWIESRVFSDLALQSLSTHPLANDMHQRLQALVPKEPDIIGLEPLHANTSLRC